MISLTGKKKNKGFLLLEAMVSGAILSIGLVLILNSFIHSLRGMEISQDYFKAGLLLEEKLYEIYNSDIDTGSTTGRFADLDENFSWILNLTKVDEEPLNEVELKVTWDKRKKEQDISILTYLYVR